MSGRGCQWGPGENIAFIALCAQLGKLPGGWGGGGGGPLGSAPREYVGFLLAAPGDGSLLPPSAALNAQLLPYIFFPLLSPRVLLIHLESREPHICQHSEKAVGVFAEIALDI